jgi:hypothetical protein
MDESDLPASARTFLAQSTLPCYISTGIVGIRCHGALPFRRLPKWTPTGIGIPIHSLVSEPWVISSVCMVSFSVSRTTMKRLLLLTVQRLWLLFVGAQWIQAHDVVSRRIQIATNDRRDNALPITPGVLVYSNLSEATTDGESNLLDIFCFPRPPLGPGLWYSLNGTGERFYARLFPDCSIVPSAALLTVFMGSSYTLNVTNYDCALLSRELCSDIRSVFYTQPGIPYYVLIASPVPTQTVNFSIFVDPPIPNESCSNPTSISIGATVYVNFTFANTVGKGSNYYTCSADTPGLWYTLVGTGERLVGQLGQTCNTSQFTFMIIFTGNCDGSFPPFQCIASSSNLCNGRPFFFDTELGTTYYVVIGSNVSDVIVDFSFVVGPTTNDFCRTALPMTIGSTVYANFTYASRDLSEVSTDCIYEEDAIGFPFLGPPDFPGVWYTFVGTGERLVGQLGQLCSDFSVFRYTYMSVYRGDCGFANLRCVKATEFLCNGESFFFDTIRGRTYHVLVQSVAHADQLVDFTIAATKKRCGFLGLGLFCPLTLYGLFGRLLRRLFDF